MRRSSGCLHTPSSTVGQKPLVEVLPLSNNNNKNIFIQDFCISFKKESAINAGPV